VKAKADPAAMAEDMLLPVNWKQETILFGKGQEQGEGFMINWENEEDDVKQIIRDLNYMQN